MRFAQGTAEVGIYRCLGLAVLGVIITAHLHAQELHWENRELKFEPSPADTTVVAHFRFRNVGESNVKITSVNSSCSCTTLKVDNKEIPPSGSGEIEATFNIGDRKGLQEKTIAVESNDQKSPVTMLLMKVAIPEIAQMRPSFLYWSPSETLAAKEINFRVGNGFPVKTVTVESSNAKIGAKVEPVKQGQEYKIIVTPSETDQQIMAMLSIKTDYPPDNPKTFYANVRVQPQK